VDFLTTAGVSLEIPSYSTSIFREERKRGRKEGKEGRRGRERVGAYEKSSGNKLVEAYSS
jgi:hypothetical protein